MCRLLSRQKGKTMSRYIDADALKRRVGELIVPEWVRTLIRTWLESAPTVDAVPVVRCQNCKHYCGEDTYTNHRICKMWNEEVFANGYCYYGERKDGAE